MYEFKELKELMKKKKGFANQRNILMFLILATTGIRRKNVQNLLITRQGEKCTIESISHIANKLSKKYNIDFTLHSFRRGLATELYNDNNIQVQDIALLLGHKKVQTTVDHYIKADKKRLNTALENHDLFKIKEEEPKCVHFNDILKMFREREIKEN